ncbi:hypothetical protein [Asticcacaulis taihuensis]|uniref:hypothetical protein n=1 Tax=Asticcacaulis taihuensis TaxID=260084 RepID=UPI003F7B69E1
MRTSPSRPVIIAVCGLILSGCNRLGLCTEDHVNMILSPSGRYQVEIVSKDCVGSSPVQEVFLRRARGVMKGRTAVAIFDASNPDKPVHLSVSWRDERHLMITARGAKVWAFQPNWHDVWIMERWALANENSARL